MALGASLWHTACGHCGQGPAAMEKLWAARPRCPGLAGAACLRWISLERRRGCGCRSRVLSSPREL